MRLPLQALQLSEAARGVDRLLRKAAAGGAIVVGSGGRASQEVGAEACVFVPPLPRLLVSHLG